MQIEERHGLRVHRLETTGEPWTTNDATADLIGTAMYDRVDLIVVPIERVDPAFFELSSGIAGELLQKATNYRLRLAIVGDVTARTADSSSLRAFVDEAQRGGGLWFVPDDAALEARLVAAAV
ncbi:MAG: DUF4180 domain-containing protein [Patulibacter sp.]|nr:DUF4180 domain-containing protein [Patulibacter sp.]